MAPSPTQQAGDCAERAAAEFLRRHGLAVLQRNFRRRTGELDLVARDGDVLVIVEVRMRAAPGAHWAAASIDARKQRRIIRTTHQLLQRHPGYARMPVRFDALLIDDAARGGGRITWVQAAFST